MEFQMLKLINQQQVPILVFNKINNKIANKNKKNINNFKNYK